MCANAQDDLAIDRAVVHKEPDRLPLRPAQNVQAVKTGSTEPCQGP